jgi:integrase
MAPSQLATLGSHFHTHAPIDRWPAVQTHVADAERIERPRSQVARQRHLCVALDDAGQAERARLVAGEYRAWQYAYLRVAQVKRPRVSNHALRHTSATLAYRYTHHLRAVHDMLGH